MVELVVELIKRYSKRWNIFPKSHTPLLRPCLSCRGGWWRWGIQKLACLKQIRYGANSIMDHLVYIKNISLHRWVPAWAEKQCLPWIDNNSQLMGAHQREGKEGEDYVGYSRGPGLRDCWHGDGAKPWACIWRALWVGGTIRLGHMLSTR